MEQLPHPLDKIDKRPIAAVAAVFLAAVAFQTGRDIERPGPDEVTFNPVSWVAAPTANTVDNIGLTDK